MSDSPTDAFVMAPKPRKLFKKILLVAVILLAGIQAVPYGRNHTNPKVTADIAWDSPQTEQLVRGACFDCHSNETVWPWYSHIAPASWLVQRDVDHARANLNFSTGHLAEVQEAAHEVSTGEMPPWFYIPLHDNADLTQDEKETLIKGLNKTFASES